MPWSEARVQDLQHGLMHLADDDEVHDDHHQEANHDSDKETPAKARILNGSFHVYSCKYGEFWRITTVFFMT